MSVFTRFHILENPTLFYVPGQTILNYFHFADVSILFFHLVLNLIYKFLKIYIHVLLWAHDNANQRGHIHYLDARL